MREQSEFASRLSLILQARGVTQAELADRIQVTQAAMSRYASGEREPRLVTLIQIARALNVSTDDLLGVSTFSAGAEQRAAGRSKWLEFDGWELGKEDK